MFLYAHYNRGGRQSGKKPGWLTHLLHLTGRRNSSRNNSCGTGSALCRPAKASTSSASSTWSTRKATTTTSSRTMAGETIRCGRQSGLANEPKKFLSGLDGFPVVGHGFATQAGGTAFGMLHMPSHGGKAERKQRGQWILHIVALNPIPPL